MELEEKDFIHEEYGKNPAPFWFWLVFSLTVVGVIAYITYFTQEKEKATIASNPFLQVTNRDFSLFLWQNPGFMKQNLKGDRSYLPAWGDRLTVDPTRADEWVEATPTALFMYHTWSRLVGDYVYSRSISQKEFLKFLEADPQWDPRYWKNAPVPYITLIRWMEGNNYNDLKELSYKELPQVVRQAFIGWKNYTQESQAINTIKPTWRQVWTFLDLYPNFKRSFWINLVKEERPYYLKNDDVKGTDVVSEDRMDGLLKMALYNYTYPSNK